MLSFAQHGKRYSSSFLQGLGGWDAIPFLRSCRCTRRTRTLRFSLLRCGERPGRHPDVASGGYSYPGCPRYATWCERRGGVVRSDIRVPEAKRGRVPCRNEDEYRFPRGFQTELHVSPRVVRPGGFTFSRFRRQSLPRRRSPPRPSAHEYAAPYPAPSPPGTRPRGESPWGQRRGRYRRTAP